MTDDAPLSDNDLVEELQRSALRAGEKLYRRYHERVERYCHHLIHDGDLAKDAEHETFVAAMSAIGTLRDSASFRSWLFRIAQNQCLMTMHRSSPLVRLEDSDDVWEDRTPYSMLLRGELQQVGRDAVDRLKPIDREVLVLRESGGLSYREIAETTEAPIASVKFRLHNARKALADSRAGYLDEGNAP